MSSGAQLRLSNAVLLAVPHAETLTKEENFPLLHYRCSE